MGSVTSKGSSRICSWSSSFQYLFDLFYLTKPNEVFNFAEDATFFVSDFLIKKLEHGNLLATEWFQNNNMTLNQDKCHLLV